MSPSNRPGREGRTPRAWILAGLGATVLVLAVGLVSHRLAQPPELTDEEKLYGLSLLWQEANYNFAFFDQVPDLDWDEAYREAIPRILATESTYDYYRELQRFVALLNDGHTSVWMPRSLRGERRRRDTYPWLRTERVGDRVLVRRVGADLAEAVPLHSEILEIDGRPAMEVAVERQRPWVAQSSDHYRADRIVARALHGPADRSVEVLLETPAGERRTLELERDRWTRSDEWVPGEVSEPDFELEWIDDDIAYVALRSFDDPAVADAFDAALPDLGNARALVIDLRDNQGGSSSIGYRVVSRITDRTLRTSAWRTREHRAAHKAWGRYAQQYPDRYGQYADYAKMDAWHDGGRHPDVEPASGERLILPTIVLQGHDTFSAAEDFLVAIDALPHVTTVGRPSAGSTGQPLVLELPGGGGGRIVTKRDTFPDGRDFVGVGVPPDVHVERTVRDVRQGRDADLQRAVELLREKLASIDAPVPDVRIPEEPTGVTRARGRSSIARDRPEQERVAGTRDHSADRPSTDSRQPRRK